MVQPKLVQEKLAQSKSLELALALTIRLGTAEPLGWQLRGQRALLARRKESVGPDPRKDGFRGLSGLLASSTLASSSPAALKCGPKCRRNSTHTHIYKYLRCALRPRVARKPARIQKSPRRSHASQISPCVRSGGCPATRRAGQKLVAVETWLHTSPGSLAVDRLHSCERKTVRKP